MKEDLMKKTFTSALLALLVAAPSAVCAQTGVETPENPGRDPIGNSSAVETPETVIRQWPELPREIARETIEKYGEPTQFDDNELIWADVGRWKRTVVYRNGGPRSFWTAGRDHLEQTIVYQVPDDKLEALRRFDPRIKVDKTTAELSARSESEGLNFLALNLAEEIVTEMRGVDDARGFYRETAELAKSGKSSPYLEGFVFSFGSKPVLTPVAPAPVLDLP
jgi:hypothetical protein